MAKMINKRVVLIGFIFLLAFAFEAAWAWVLGGMVLRAREDIVSSI